MTMGFKISGIMFLCSLASGTELIAFKDYLKAQLGAYPKLSKEAFALSGDQKKALKAVAPDSTDENFTFYFGKNDKGVMENACAAISQAGKEGPMTVGVCFSPVGVVNRVTILDYVEERGKPVKEEAFLSQFKGKKVSASFHVGEDIDGVSGATHSSKAVSEAVRKASFAFKTFVMEKKP